MQGHKRQYFRPMPTQISFQAVLIATILILMQFILKPERIHTPFLLSRLTPRLGCAVLVQFGNQPSRLGIMQAGHTIVDFPCIMYLLGISLEDRKSGLAALIP